MGWNVFIYRSDHFATALNININMLLVCDQEALKHPWCDLLYLTDIMAEFDCDIFFPDFDKELFKVQERYVSTCCPQPLWACGSDFRVVLNAASLPVASTLKVICFVL